jgi:hypothetical protein
MGETQLRMSRPRPPARWATQHSHSAVLALLRSLRGTPDGEGERADLSPRELKRRKVRRAMAKASRRANR